MKRILLSALSLLMMGNGYLAADDPFSDVRFNNDPMVAETGGYYSMYSNPAGMIKDDDPLDFVLSVPVLNLEAYASEELFAAINGIIAGDYDIFLKYVEPFTALTTLASIGNADSLALQDTSAVMFQTLNELNEISRLAAENSDEDTEDFANVYDQLFAGTSLEGKEDLGPEDLLNLTTFSVDPDNPMDLSDIEQINKNVETFLAGKGAQDILTGYFEAALHRQVRLLEEENMETNIAVHTLDIGSTFNRFLGSPFTFGWSVRPVGFRMYLALGSSDPATFTTGIGGEGISLEVPIPVTAKIYINNTARIGFAYNPLPGLNLGVSPYMSLMFGIDDSTMVELVKQYQASDLINQFDTEKKATEFVSRFINLAWGFDVGATYNFGALWEPLDFLNAGIRIRDLIGGVHTVANDFKNVNRYPLDFDIGIFAEKTIMSGAMTINGGVDIVELNSYYKPELKSTFSSLEQRPDHVRVRVGAEFLRNMLRASLQIYNSQISAEFGLQLGFMDLAFQLTFGNSLGGSIRAVFLF